MDSNKDIRYYQNCDELPMFNFEKIRTEKNFSWLVYGYDGWGEVKIPSNATEVWDKILNEYADLTKNNKTLQYFELIADSSDLQLRYDNASNLINQLENRPMMDVDMKKAYMEELRGWRFYFNDSKPFDSEIKRMKSQLRAVGMKINMMSKDVKNFEEKTEQTDLVKIKVTVQNLIKRDLDLKKISVKEWLFTLESLPKKKVA